MYPKERDIHSYIPSRYDTMARWNLEPWTGEKGGREKETLLRCSRLITRDMSSARGEIYALTHAAELENEIFICTW